MRAPVIRRAAGDALQSATHLLATANIAAVMARGSHLNDAPAGGRKLSMFDLIDAAVGPARWWSAATTQ